MTAAPPRRQPLGTQRRLPRTGASSNGGADRYLASARQATEEGLVTMHAILMLLYAVGVVLSAAAFALALVCWVIDRAAAFSAR
jgi:hypothetical protein